MAYYTIANIRIIDFSWVPEYQAQVPPIIAEFGGEILLRTPVFDWVEGQELGGEEARVDALLIVRWPSKQAADDFYQSELYKPWLKARLAGADTRLIGCEGGDTLAAMLAAK